LDLREQIVDYTLLTACLYRFAYSNRLFLDIKQLISFNNISYINLFINFPTLYNNQLILEGLRREDFN